MLVDSVERSQVQIARFHQVTTYEVVVVMAVEGEKVLLNQKE